MRLVEVRLGLATVNASKTFIATICQPFFFFFFFFVFYLCIFFFFDNVTYIPEDLKTASS